MPVTTASLFTVQSIRELVTDPLFRRSVVLDSGLIRLDTDSTKVLLPVISGGTAGWHVELQTLTDANVAASELEVVPRKIGCLQLVSSEAASDANAAQLVGSALVSALASGVDQQFFLGTDADGPDGLEDFYSDGLEVVDASASTSLDPYTDGVAALEDNGATPSVIWMRGSTWAALSKVKQASGSTMPVLNPQPTGSTSRSIQGIPVRVSQYVPEATAYVADTSQIVAVHRTDPSVEVDRSAAFVSDGVYIRAIERISWAIPAAGMVARIADVA
jgi:HK97 family phage major capsid protein